MEVSVAIRGAVWSGTGGALYLLVVLLNFAMALTGPGDVYAAQGKPAAQAGAAAAEPFGQDAFGTHSAAAEVELQKGIALTSQGRFSEAIPHLRAAQGRVREDYAADFNLALCYVATGQDKPAIRLLTELRESGHNTANLHDLLAQAYAGTGQEVEALKSLEQALALEPNNEKLYVYVEDAATGHQNYELALKILDLSLQRMPNSARLHYERGVLLSMLDEFDSGRKDFDAARQLAPASTIAYLAAAQTSLYEGNINDAIRVAREGVQKGDDDYLLLAILGEALIRSGIEPGESGFLEAKAALEKSVAQKPNYSSSQISLGKICLMEGRLDDAISHLEIGRTLKPDDAAVYATLATAYRRKGEAQRAQEMLTILAQLNREQAARIAGAGGDHRSAYGLSRVRQPDAGSASQP